MNTTILYIIIMNLSLIHILKPEQISRIIRSQIKYYENAIEQTETGTVTMLSLIHICVYKRQGLCPICGRKKAAGCSCQPADNAAPVDARLSILKQLLS